MTNRLDLDKYCTRCDSDQYTTDDKHDQLLWCALCWDWQRRIGSRLRDFIEGKLPNADAFNTAANLALRDGLQELFLHDAEGTPFAVILPMVVYQEKVSWDELPEGEIPNHDHIESDMGHEVPWNARHGKAGV